MIPTIEDETVMDLTEYELFDGNQWISITKSLVQMMLISNSPHNCGNLKIFLTNFLMLI